MIHLKLSMIFSDIPVLKYSGLAKGKGVYLPSDISELYSNMLSLFQLGNSGIIMERTSIWS